MRENYSYSSNRPLNIQILQSFMACTIHPYLYYLYGLYVLYRAPVAVKCTSVSTPL